MSGRLTAVDSGDQPHSQRPHGNEKVGEERVINVRVASISFEDIEPVSLHDVGCEGVRRMLQT